jgi:hypothetical protein
MTARSARIELDERIDLGRKPVFWDITLSDAPAFTGKLTENSEFYNGLSLFPRLVIGSYRGVVIVLDVKRI